MIETSYNTISDKMENLAEEVHKAEWFSKKFNTYGHPNNSYSKVGSGLWILDYFFKRVNAPEKIGAWASNFELPLFKTKISRYRLFQAKLKRDEKQKNAEFHKGYMGHKTAKDIFLKTRTKRKTLMLKDKNNRSSNFEDVVYRTRYVSMISLSDHEAISTTMYVWKKGIFE